MAKVIRVFGKADAFDIEFSRNGEKWEVDIPPDMTDGVYAVQLTAIDELGDFAYWVGELYMSNGVCCFKFAEIPYKARLKPKNYNIEFHKHKYSVVCQPSSYAVEFKKDTSIQVKKKKQKKTNYAVDFFKNLSINEYIAQHTLQIERNEIDISKQTELHIKDTSNTEIFLRKGCYCE